MRVWREKVIPEVKSMYDPRFPELREFVYQALDCMQSLSLRQEIVADILKYCKETEAFAVNSLYYIRHEGLKRNNDKLESAINEFISSLSKPWQIAVVGNVMSLLTEEQKLTMKSKICELLDTEDFSDLAYSSAMHFFSSSDAELQSKIISSISNSKLLWKTGIHEDGHYSSADEPFLSITSYDSLNLTTADIVMIYQQLKKALSGITSSRVFKTPFYHMLSLEDVLLEMLTFLNQNKKVLKIQSDFDEVFYQVNEVYQNTQDTHSVEDGLLSIYDEELESALHFIYSNRKEMNHERFLSLVDLVLNRVLLMNSDGLDKCLRMIRYCISDGSLSKADKSQLALVKMILDRTSLSILNTCNLNLATATNNLSAIAGLMAKMGFKSEGIQYWQDFANRHRFYTNFI